MSIYTDPYVREFIRDNSIGKRKAVVAKIINLYPDKIPIVIGRAELKNTPEINKHKYLVSKELTFGKFILEVRKQMVNLNSNMSLFFFVGDNRIPSTSVTISELYDKYKASDGFLYMIYSSENTFG